jgi:DNA invertase Pin-like site-specific DNA recombinase
MMTTVGYARVSSTGQDWTVQLEKLGGCDKVFKEKRPGVDAGRPALQACLDYLREGDTLLVTKLDKHRHDLAHWQADHGHPRLNR